MDILAFDPGTEILGIAFLTGPSGSHIEWIREITLKGELHERYKGISNYVDGLLKEVFAGDAIDVPTKFRKGEQYCAIETPYIGFNPSAGMKLSTVRGLIMSPFFLCLSDPKIIDVAPQEIRGIFQVPVKSKKEEYHKIIKKHYGDKISKDIKEDGLDALAVGLTAATKIRKDLWWQQNG
jgi:Holliday junction resolvasome RuvABC endonuclease subunit